MDAKETHSLLFSAIQHHNDTLLDDLLNGEDGRKLLNQPAADGLTLLHSAVIESDLSCVETLLKHGANPNAFDGIRARTPMHLAVELGQTEIVKTFLELEHVNLDLRDDRNLTCYEIAQFCDNPNLAEIIKRRQDEIEKLRDDFYTVMNQACATNDLTLVRRLLDRYERQIAEKLPRGWSPSKDVNRFARSSLKELINWSSSSWNDVTLLFKSASKGHTQVCKLLIEYGAIAKCNENTNYSPLYVAAYGGFTDTVRLLLDSFPALVREVTIERWTILHAACLQGHSETTKLILNYPYPASLKSRYVSRSGIYEYYFAFDLNAQDAAGQTAIYLAVSANDERLLDTLLSFSIEAKQLNIQEIESAHSSQINDQYHQRKPQDKNSLIVRNARIIPDRPPTTSNDRGAGKNQLDNIIRQLRRIDSKVHDSSTDNHGGDKTSNENLKYLICPFEMDTYCDYNSKTALHLAVCQQYHAIATTLLVNGSNPNLPILSRDPIKSDSADSKSDIGLNWLRSSKSMCLKEACRLNDEIMCDILIRYGASDDQDNLALQVAAANKNSRLISKFLTLKSNLDPEYKINKKCNVEFASRFKQCQKLSRPTHGSISTTFSSMFPASPVMIDWQNLRCVKHVDPQWLIEASLSHNKRLKHPTNSLMAITRLDLSSNNLKSAHPVIFRLPSLRELNLSNNRLESLLDASQRASIEGDSSTSTSKLIESQRTAMKRSKSSNLSTLSLENSNLIDLNEPQEWDLPYLETLDLHDNLLISLPDCLFGLPRLGELDVSSNQIRQLPWAMWTAPALKEVIASGNLLDDLPKVPYQPRHKNSPRLELNESPNEERSSVISEDRFEGSFLSSVDSDSTRDHSSLPNLDTSDMSGAKLECLGLAVDHLNYWRKKIDLVSDSAIEKSHDEANPNGLGGSNTSRITYLNLSHNSFESIPPVLACMATELTRLNLSHNRISSLGDISLYPSKLKTLDLSNNQIVSWFVMSDQRESDLKHCYADNVRGNDAISKFHPNHNGLFCPHKLHYRLDSLKMMNLSHNQIREIQLTLPVDSSASNISRNSSKSNLETTLRDQLSYQNITALDVSYNKIQQVPKSIAELKDLSVLNLSGNNSITTLPAELGLASKLWNLGINGCNLNEPLKSVVESKSYKTIDMIGYLRSILEEAKPYARMKLMLVGLQGIGKTSLLEQMRQEGSSGSRRRAPEHWTKRMGHTSRSNIRNQRGVTLSTVGVDIHDWIFCKRVPRSQPSFGPVSFSTWDFGGQEEFYATHRYFLSRRSIYLVVWRLTDGINGILGIQQWLVNIQSRAPGAPVIIVGTHEDMIEGGDRGEKVHQLQEEVHRRFINVSDQDKCGLPRVMDSLVVSTKTRYNIKNLCNRIYDVVFSLRSPGGTEQLLRQRIPATYLYLEEIVSWIVYDRQQRKREPVLTYEEYKKVASEQLKSKYNKTFRDLEPLNSREINYNSELQQATRFLHENGVLLHYEDANLRDLYFLDPQWLCDILSHVVTIREINPHVKNGLMKIDDLTFLFKSMDVNLSGGIQSYIVNLLNKFEVALTWNSQYLLIPSLLPSDPNSFDRSQDFQVKMTPRMRGRSAMRRYEPSRSNLRSTSIGPQRPNTASPMGATNHSDIEYQPDKNVYRLVLLRYLPAGFLARLQSGILSDPEFDDVCTDLHSSFEISSEGRVSGKVGNRAGWTCWKSGIRLNLQHESSINTVANSHISLMSIEEVGTMSKNPLLTRGKFMVDCAQMNSCDPKNPQSSVEIIGSKWTDFDVSQYSNVLILKVYRWRLKIADDDGSSVRYIEPEHQHVAKILSTAADHIDNLLEDWYPSLGARFAHTLGGNYLVTRVIPCTGCSASFSGSSSTRSQNHRSSRFDSRRSKAKVNFSIQASTPDDSNSSSLFKSAVFDEDDASDDIVYCFYAEHCILYAYNISQVPMTGAGQGKRSLGIAEQPLQRVARSSQLRCPRHGIVTLNLIAPDIVFDDISEMYKIDNDQIERCKLIGRGTFGFVFRGSLRSTFPLNQLGQADQEVALKLLQPVEPGPEAEHADLVAYKSARSNWLREPFQCACKSYCTARHEISILQALRHPNIVLFIGVCVKPLAIVLELAPLGCLTDVFKNYKKAGMRLDQFSVQKTLVQIARALEFLHQQRIIYRDLKAENVLVWSFPSPFATRLQTATVELKLADYGISRQVLSTGIWKGFAGTINFLAPEILRHNGDEEYTEKVDCFSFGMFMYELLTLRPPFKHNEGAKSHLADGGRPTLAMRDLIYPNYMIDLMSVCWSQEPHHRPTASQIVSIVSTPEFMQLLDVVAIEPQAKLTYNGAVQYINSSDCNLDLWFGSQAARFDILSARQGHWIDYNRLESSASEVKSSDATITCLCVVDNSIWLADSKFMVHVVPLGPHSRNHTDLMQPNSDGRIDHQEVLNRAQTFSLGLRSNSSVKEMTFVKSASVVLMLLRNGQLWLCQTETMSCRQLDDGSIPFTCMVVQKTRMPFSGSSSPDSQNIEGSFNLLCGQSSGISCLEIVDSCINRQSILPLVGKLVDLSGERVIDAGQPTEVSSILSSGDLLWTAAGCTVHLWSIADKCVARKLDCWKLVPCSESLESINIELYYQEARSSYVSSMVYLSNQLFVGTSHGCFMVIEADTLKPMIVFRPYESNITIIRPFIVREGDEEHEPSCLVTIGSGYRDLMKRYVNTLDGCESSITDVAVLWSANYYNL